MELKGFKQTTPFEEAIEQIERIIEALEPGKVVRLPDIIGKNADRAITKATITLLKKYGITYLED